MLDSQRMNRCVGPEPEDKKPIEINGDPIQALWRMTKAEGHKKGLPVVSKSTQIDLKDNAKRRVWEAVMNADGWISSKEICKSVGCERSTATKYLMEFSRGTEIDRKKDGRFWIYRKATTDE